MGLSQSSDPSQTRMGAKVSPEDIMSYIKGVGMMEARALSFGMEEYNRGDPVKLVGEDVNVRMYILLKGELIITAPDAKKKHRLLQRMCLGANEKARMIAFSPDEKVATFNIIAGEGGAWVLRMYPKVLDGLLNKKNENSPEKIANAEKFSKNYLEGLQENLIIQYQKMRINPVSGIIKLLVGELSRRPALGHFAFRKLLDVCVDVVGYNTDDKTQIQGGAQRARILSEILNRILKI